MIPLYHYGLWGKKIGEQYLNFKKKKKNLKVWASDFIASRKTLISSTIGFSLSTKGARYGEKV